MGLDVDELKILERMMEREIKMNRKHLNRMHTRLPALLMACILLAGLTVSTVLPGRAEEVGFIKVNTGNVALREQAGTSCRKLAILPKGAVLPWYSKTKVKTDGYYWYECEYNGMRGYMAANYATVVNGPEPTPAPKPTGTPKVTPGPERTSTPAAKPTPTATPRATETPAGQKLRLTAGSVALREQAGTSYRKLATLSKGTVLTWYSKTTVKVNGYYWYECEYSGMRGYVAADYITVISTAAPTLKPTPTATPKATETPVPTSVPTVQPTPTATPKATKTPDPTAAPTVKPTPTATPKATETPVSTATPTVKPTPTATPKETATPAGQLRLTAGSVALREKAGTSYRKLTTLSKGTVLTWYSKTTVKINGYYWYECEYKGMRGYVAADYVTVTHTAAPTAKPTATPKTSATPTVTPKATATPAPTDVPTATPAPTATPEATATPIPTDTPVETPVPTGAPTPTPVPEIRYVKTKCNLNFRQSPGGKILGSVKTGTKLPLLGSDDTGKWYCVYSTAYGYGYVSSDPGYVTVIVEKSADVTPVPLPSMRPSPPPAVTPTPKPSATPCPEEEKGSLSVTMTCTGAVLHSSGILEVPSSLKTGESFTLALTSPLGWTAKLFDTPGTEPWLTCTGPLSGNGDSTLTFTVKSKPGSESATQKRDNFATEVIIRNEEGNELSFILVMYKTSLYPNDHINTGDYVDDLIDVALTQLGYEGSNKADDYDGSVNKGNQHGDFTKYGRYMGIGGNPWCASFISWCANQAGIPTEVLGHTTYASPGDFSKDVKSGKTPVYYFNDLNDTQKKTHPYLEAYGVKEERDNCAPQRGDLIFFRESDAKNTVTFSHVGLVLTSEDGVITYIDGNGSNSDLVALHTIWCDDPYIAAYCTPW